MKILQSAERISDTNHSDNFVFQRSILAYHLAAQRVKGQVLEIGTGEGYGISIISSKADSFLTIDKFAKNIDLTPYSNVSFRQMNVPPLAGLGDNTFDFVISFQVIEHIEDDAEFLKEIHRVLKPGGQFICTTPNKPMSITRNPWHVREYTVEELQALMTSIFSRVETNGIVGNKTVMDYFEQNKKSVQRITRFDIFDLQHKLPRTWLQIPYDILNRMNRKKLLQSNYDLTTSIKMDDYSMGVAGGEAFDHFFIGVK